MADVTNPESVTGRDAVLHAFDRLFDRAAAKLRVECGADEKAEAKRGFAERFAPALALVERLQIHDLPEDAVQAMEAAIDHLSPAQIVAHLATIPLAHQAQEMMRAVAYEAAQRRVLEHLVSQADDRYGGN